MKMVTANLMDSEFKGRSSKTGRADRASAGSWWMNFTRVSVGNRYQAVAKMAS